MSPRYLLVVGDSIADRGDLLRSLGARTGLEPAFSNPRIAAFANSSCGCVAVGESGCVLGYLFKRHGPARQVGDLAAAEAGRIAASGGRTLLTEFWGGYVAAISDARSAIVLRDPSGCFPCYHCRFEDLIVLASDADLLVESGAAWGDADLEEVGRQLFRAFVPVRTTALRDVRELLAGFAMRVPGDMDHQEPCWSPWDHAADYGDDPADAAGRLSDIVGHSVRSWSSSAQPILLSVSGGLDSSIVAACLARAGVETICLTMFTDDPSGDERRFARALCDHLGLPLVEARTGSRTSTSPSRLRATCRGRGTGLRPTPMSGFIIRLRPKSGRAPS